MRMQSPDTAPLEPYIRAALGEDYSGNMLSPANSSNQPPMLLRGVENHILMFRGSFNPPHIGHHAFLSTAMTLSHLTITAAFVLPLSDRALKHKYKPETDPLVLSKEERIKLWQGGLQDGQKTTFFWDKPNGEQWWDFWSELKEICLEDGFEISLVRMLGPDHIGKKVIPDFASNKKVQKIMTSNVSRKVDYLRVDGSVERLSGWGEWERLEMSADKQMDKMCASRAAPPVLTATSPQLSLDQAPSLSTLQAGQRDIVWECHLDENPTYTICFVSSSAEQRLLISSTAIRDILREDLSREKLFMVLAKIVLQPKMLLEMIDRRNVLFSASSLVETR